MIVNVVLFVKKFIPLYIIAEVIENHRFYNTVVYLSVYAVI